MGNKKHMAIIGIAATMALGLAGCGNAAEKLTERAIEESAGGDVDLDLGGDGFSIDTPEGAMRMDEDGNMVIVGADGEEIRADAEGNISMEGDDGETSYNTGDNATVPEGWPAPLALPSGANLLTSQRSTINGETTASVTAQTSVSVKDLYDTYKDALEDDGYTIGGDSITEGSSGSSAQLSAEKGDQEVTVYALDSGDEVTLTISVTGG